MLTILEIFKIDYLITFNMQFGMVSIIPVTIALFPNNPPPYNILYHILNVFTVYHSTSTMTTV